MTPLERRLWRAALTPSALLTADEVVEAIPAPAEGTRTWLLDQVPALTTVAGVALWSWGSVLERMHHTSEQASASTSGPGSRWLTTAEVANQLGIPRSTLDAMVRRAPRDLPGAPTKTGTGRKRQHLRWDASSLTEWLQSYQRWDVDRVKRSSRKPAKKKRPASQPAATTVDWSAVVKDYGQQATEDGTHHRHTAPRHERTAAHKP
jgi:predicted DNA-binding transcriptional regulator AlpA